MNYFEYTTLTDFKAAKIPGSTGTSDDTLILDYIREVSKIINDVTGRKFVPLIATRTFDANRDAHDGLLLRVDPWDLLAIGTITNGDATAVASTSYVFEPRGVTPYWGIRLKSSKGITWTYTDDPEDAISLSACTWGYHDDYANAWESLTTLGAALNISATSATLASGVGNPGELWKIDSEYLYLSARTTTTATVVRGVNGSTAATHDNGATITRWIPVREVSGLCRAAVAMKYALRENPQVETLIIDGRTLSVAKDVTQWIREQVGDLGLKRV